MMSESVMRYVRLEAYARLEQVISDHECFQILGFRPPRTGFKDYCYKFVRAGYAYRSGLKNKKQKDGTVVEVPGLIKQSLWKIVKVDLEAEAQAKLAAKQQQQLTEEAYEEAAARENYGSMKEAILG